MDYSFKDIAANIISRFGPLNSDESVVESLLVDVHFTKLHELAQVRNIEKR